MKIAALLCWWDEPQALLDRMIRSLAGVADTLVALDGAWERMPGGTPMSPAEQCETIHASASAVGITATTVTTAGGWSSQIAKRAALMDAGCETDADWLLVVDADDFVAHFDPAIFDLLERTDLDVAEFDCDYPIGKRAACRRVRRLFRASSGVTVAGAHNGYQAADGRWLHGPSNVPTEPALDLERLIVLGHDSSPRTGARMAAMAAYYADRGARGEETLRREVFA